MAETLVRLTRPSSKHVPPFFYYAKTGFIGTDTVSFKPDKYLQTPSVFTPLYIRVYLDTDATVANRSVKIRKFESGLGAVLALSTVDIAANLTKYCLFSNVDENLMSNMAEGADYTAFMGNNGQVNSWTLWQNENDNNSIGIEIDTGKAGDAFIVWALFRYLNKELGMPNVYDGTDDWGWGGKPIG